MLFVQLSRDGEKGHERDVVSSRRGAHNRIVSRKAFSDFGDLFHTVWHRRTCPNHTAIRHSRLLILKAGWGGMLREEIIPTSPVVERLCVGVRGLFQVFAAAHKFAFQRRPRSFPRSLHQRLKPYVARNQGFEGMKGRKREGETRINECRGIKCDSKQIKKKGSEGPPDRAGRGKGPRIDGKGCGRSERGAKK